MDNGQLDSRLRQCLRWWKTQTMQRNPSSSKISGKTGSHILGPNMLSRSLNYVTSPPSMIGIRIWRRRRRACLQRYASLYVISTGDQDVTFHVLQGISVTSFKRRLARSCSWKAAGQSYSIAQTLVQVIEVVQKASHCSEVWSVLE